MKKAAFLFCPLVFIVIFSACHSPTSNSKIDSVAGDTTMYDITRPIGDNFIEDLLPIKDEKELIEKFGKDHISYDTIWGSEGMFTMGSFIDKGKNEVQLMWKDSLHRSGVASVMVVAKWDGNGKYVCDNNWKSRAGISLGMTTDELEKINGKSFSFSGFGWDYGGGIGEWKGGALENAGIGITLSEGNDQSKCTEKEMLSILGDQMIMSNNPVVKKIQPRVIMMSVYQK